MSQNKTLREKEAKKADFGMFSPPTECYTCKGRGEVKDDYIVGFFTSSYWTYKKCTLCNGTGKNIWSCIKCKSRIRHDGGFWCSNANCPMFTIIVALANKKD